MITRNMAEQARELDAKFNLCEHYHGYTTEDPNLWIKRFNRYSAIKEWNQANRLRFFPLFMKGQAAAWYESLPQATQANENNLHDAFKNRFTTDGSRWTKLSSFKDRIQQSSETVQDFAAYLQQLAGKLEKNDQELKDTFIMGLREQHVRSHVMLQNPGTFNEAVQHATTASGIPSQTGFIKKEELLVATLTDLQDEIKALRNERAVLQAQANRPRSPGQPRSPALPKKVTFAPAFPQQQQPLQQQQSPQQQRYQPSYQQPSFQQPSYQQPLYQQPSYQQPSYQQPQPQQQQSYQPRGPQQTIFRPQSTPSNQCMSCGEYDHPRHLCRFRNATCFACGKKGHISKICRSAQPSAQPSA